MGLPPLMDTCVTVGKFNGIVLRLVSSVSKLDNHMFPLQFQKGNDAQL